MRRVALNATLQVDAILSMSEGEWHRLDQNLPKESQFLVGLGSESFRVSGIVARNSGEKVQKPLDKASMVCYNGTGSKRSVP